MRFSLFALALLAAPAAAQSPAPSGPGQQCAGLVSSEATNICNAAVDATRAFHPVAGLLVSGGNPELGYGGTLGGLGHVSLTARVNAARVQLPDLGYSGTGTVPAGQNLVALSPVVEGALGVWKGLSNGLLAVDVLASAQLLPTTQIHNLTVDAGTRRIGSVALGLGYGARIGLLNGGLLLPSVSVSVMRRDIPRISYGDLAQGDNFTYSVDLHATNLRAVASKRILLLDLAAGLGLDHYTGDAVIQFQDPPPPLPGTLHTENVALSNTRYMGFANVGLDLSLAKVVGEIGYQLGKDQHLTTTFQNYDTTKGKVFGGIGLRVSL